MEGLGRFGDAIFEAMRFIYKILSRGVEFLDIALIAIKWAKVFIAPVVSKIEELVDREDERLDSLPPDAPIDLEKEHSFKTVGNEVENEFVDSSAAKLAPRGIIDGLIKYIVYAKHSMNGDPRNDKARNAGILRAYTEDETKKIVEEGLNKGWGHGR